MSFFPTFFGAILGPIWLPFSGPKIFIFFWKISQNWREGNRTPPFYKAFSSKRAPDPQNVPKWSPKCSQNASQNVPKRPPNVSFSVPLRAFFATMPLRHLETYGASWLARLVGLGVTAKIRRASGQRRCRPWGVSPSSPIVLEFFNLIYQVDSTRLIKLRYFDLSKYFRGPNRPKYYSPRERINVPQGLFGAHFPLKTNFQVCSLQASFFASDFHCFRSSFWKEIRCPGTPKNATKHFPG